MKEELPNIQNIEIGKVLDAFRVQKDIAGDVSLTLIFFKVSADFSGDPQISDEHEQWKWVSKDEAVKTVQESCRIAVQKSICMSNKPRKLVRDNIPQIIRDSGQASETRILSQDEKRRALLDKLIEEATELRDDPGIAERADVAEVLKELDEMLGLSAEVN